MESREFQRRPEQSTATWRFWCTCPKLKLTKVLLLLLLCALQLNPLRAIISFESKTAKVAQDSHEFRRKWVLQMSTCPFPWGISGLSWVSPVHMCAPGSTVSRWILIGHRWRKRCMQQHNFNLIISPVQSRKHETRHRWREEGTEGSRLLHMQQGKSV